MTALARNACSFLFVPASRPERLAKALASGADMVIADWEDAVAPADKPAARQALEQAGAHLSPAQRARMLVRINAFGTPWFDDDVAALARLVAQGVCGAVVSKAEEAQVLARVARAAGPACALLPLVESLAGLDTVDALARAPQVARLVFGHLDFQVDTGLQCGPREDELLSVRTALVFASRRAGLAAPVDGVTVDARDMQRAADDTQRALRLGFGAKLCIHPRQVAAVQAAFMPDAERVAWARRVCAAFAAAGGAAVAIGGQMIDKPLHERALAILRSAGGTA